MLNATLAKLLKESYEKGDKINKDFMKLTEDLDNNAIPQEEIIDRVGIMSQTYNEWKVRHEILLGLGYATSDAVIDEQLRELVKEEA